MLAIYKSKDGRILPLTSVEDGGKFYSELEPRGVRVALSQQVNDVRLGLLLLTSGLNRDELIQDINEKIALLNPPELDEFLDQDGFRAAFNQDFEGLALSQVREFSSQLDERIALSTGTYFHFQYFDLDLPADSMW
jgi:hypothetical protein